jgi:hypothetical protein
LSLKENWLNNRKKIKMQKQIDEDRERWQHVRINQILRSSKMILNNAKIKKTVIQKRNKKLQKIILTIHSRIKRNLAHSLPLLSISHLNLKVINWFHNLSFNKQLPLQSQLKVRYN